jgi:uncharacterized protein YcbK (DUF882 family)
MSVARGLWLAAVLASALVAVPAPGAPKKKAPVRRAAAPSYRDQVRRWHERDAGASAPRDERGRDKLVLEAINLNEKVELEASSDRGEFSESERKRAAHLLRDGRHGGDAPLDPALLDLLYQIQKHFDAPCVRVISAYRKPTGAKRSEHGRGRAVDIVVPGVADATLAAWVRGLGGTGVGLYPVSGFVHVDLRTQSHYWVDSSGPGQRSHVSGKRKPRTHPVARKG